MLSDGDQDNYAALNVPLTLTSASSGDDREREHVTLRDCVFARFVVYLAGMGPWPLKMRWHGSCSSYIIFLLDWIPGILITAALLGIYIHKLSTETEIFAAATATWLSLVLIPLDISCLTFGNVFIRRGHFDKILSLNPPSSTRVTNIAFMCACVGCVVWSLITAFLDSTSARYGGIWGTVISGVVYSMATCVYVVACIILYSVVEKYLSGCLSAIEAEGDLGEEMIRQQHMSIYAELQQSSIYLARFVLTCLLLLLVLFIGSSSVMLLSTPTTTVTTATSNGPIFFILFSLIESILYLVPAAMLNAKCKKANKTLIDTLHFHNHNDMRHDSLIIMLMSSPLHFHFFEIEITMVLVVKVASLAVSILVILIRLRAYV